MSTLVPARCVSCLADYKSVPESLIHGLFTDGVLAGVCCQCQFNRELEDVVNVRTWHQLDLSPLSVGAQNCPRDPHDVP